MDNKLAANKLAANKLAANKLAANKLAANKLAANKLQLDQVGANELLATPEGREVLGFVISCAIEPGQILVAEFEGETFEFAGEVGLANHWLTSPVDDAGAGWVSACLFARVNAANVAIPISLRGNSPILATDADERAGWSLQEGAFYGNFFTDDGEAIDWNACRGEDQAAGETGGLMERDCAEPCTPGDVLDGGDPMVSGDETICEAGQTQCGFHFAGDCGDFAAEHACKLFDDNGSFYKKCAADPIFGHGLNKKLKDEAYRQVISVYLQP
ncbi:MAG: hypothetical protein H0V17_18005 [Deltaproteobacteria bacterium]|nr:hypothetical protein [Deltaproteobacteria bacterium]